jgi:hypothetical protein
MSAAEISSGQPSALASAPTSETWWARSGVWGPLMSGSSWSRSISMTWSKNRSGSARPRVGAQVVGHGVGRVGDGLAAGGLQVAAMLSS